MKRKHIRLIPVLFLFVIPPLTSCGNGKSGTENNSGTTEITEISDDMNLLSTARVDSVLAFNSRIRSILVDSKGRYWFGSDKHGTCVFDGDTYTYYTVEQGMLSNQIQNIQEGDDGTMWFTSGIGIFKFDGKKFTTVIPDGKSTALDGSFKPDGDFDQKWEEELNLLWFGAGERNGTYRYDGETLTHFSLPVPRHLAKEDEDTYQKKGFSSYAAYSIYKDRDKNIWFGTSYGGLMKYDGKKVVCVNEKGPIGVVRAVFQDKSGVIWFANNRIGLCYLANDQLINFTTEQELGSYDYDGPENAGTLDGVQAIGQDLDGNLWFGSFSEGLWRFDGERLTQFTSENGLESDMVSSIYTDEHGETWFGIGEGNVYRFDGNRFESFSEFYSN